MRHQFRAVERRQAELRGRHDELSAQMAGAVRDHELLAALGGELAEVATALHEADEAWMELASEAEERGLSLD